MQRNDGDGYNNWELGIFLPSLSAGTSSLGIMLVFFC